MAAKLDEIVAKYLTLRDQKKVIKDDYDNKVAAIDAALERIEAYMLKQMDEHGLERLPTGAGTAYKSIRTSVSAADWDMFLDFVRNNEAWSMLERRPSKTAVEEYLAENDDLPPGVNISRAVVCNIRRS